MPTAVYKQSLPFPVALFPASPSIVLQSISLYSASASVLFEFYPAHLPKKDNQKNLTGQGVLHSSLSMFPTYPFPR